MPTSSSTSTRTSWIAVLELCCLLGEMICANGFVLRARPSRERPSFPFPIRGRSRGPSILAQTEQGTTCEDESPDAIRPADALETIGFDSARNLAPDIAYFYLQNTLGLSEEAMWKITLEAGSVLGMTPRNLEKKVSLLRRTMNLSDEDVRVVLGKQPAVLHYSADKNLAPTILFLVRALDLSKSELRTMILSCPSILGYSEANLKKKMHFFVFTLGYSDCGDKGLDGVRELLVGTPKLLLAAVDTGLVPRMKFLLNEIQFSQEELRRLYEGNPRLLLYSLDDNLREKIVFFFILRLHMEPEQVRRILLSFPQVMDYNLENHMQPIMEYFLTELGFSAAEFGSIVQKFPRVFSYSLKRIKHVVGFLRFELELGPDQAKRVIFQAPQVFGLRQGNVEEKLGCLRDRLDLTVEELGLVFSKMPTLVNLGLSNLASKLNYLEHALRCDDQSLKETILKQPTLLGYSLDRIQSRMERLIAAEMLPNKITVGISMSESKFQQWLTSSKAKRMKIDTSEFLQSIFDLNQEETNSLLLSLPNSATVRIDVEGILSLLLSLTDGDNDCVKAAVLERPHLLSFSLSKMENRIDELKPSVHTVKVMFDIATMTDEDYRTYLSLTKLRGMLNFTQNEIVSIVTGGSWSKIAGENATLALATNIDYLLKQGTKDDAKNAVLSRPKLLSHPIEKLQRTSNVLGTTTSKYATHRFGNESRAVLRDAIGLAEADINFVLSRSRYLSLRDPEEFLVPKLNYLLSEFDGCEKRVASCLLENPRLLDYSLQDWIMPRMALLIDAGLDPLQINQIISLSQDEINKRMELQSQLNLTDMELDSLVPMRAWLTRCHLRQKAQPNIQYLASHLNGSVNDLKQILLDEPKLLFRKIQPRMEELVEAGRPPTDISKVAMLSHSKAEEYFTICHLCRRLGIPSSQIDSLIASFGSTQPQSSSSLTEKIDYLLHHAFGGSEQQLRAAILEEPALLKLSLKIIKSRTEVLRFLESIGLEYRPSNMAGFFTQPRSVFTENLAPKIQNWSPSESDESRIGKDTTSGRTMRENENEILSILKDLSLPFTSFAYSDESNRGGARVVHWR